MSQWLRALIIGSVVLNLLLLLGLGYAGLHYQAQQPLFEQQRLQASAQRKELLALQLDVQTLLSSESRQLLQLEQQAQQLAEQAQQLALYQQVLASDGSGELRLVQEEIIPLTEPNHFAYRLVLLHPHNDGVRLQGQAQLRVRALHEGQSVLLEEAELGVTPTTLDFRHFQTLTGQLQLPPNSVPQTLEVQLTLDNSESRTLSLNWPSANNT